MQKRLVKSRAKTLSRDHTRDLLQLIEKSEKADDNFFSVGNTTARRIAGDYWGDSDSSSHRITINLAHSMVRSMIPSLIISDPIFDVEPKTRVDEGKEEIAKLVLNNGLPLVGFYSNTIREVYDALVYGEGWFKLVTNKIDDVGYDEGDDIDKGVVSGNFIDTQATDWETLPAPICKYIPTKSVVVDANAPARDPEYARFIAIKYEKPKSELEADPTYTLRNAVVNTGETLDDLSIGDIRKESPSTRKINKNVLGEDTVVFYEVYVYQLVGMRLYKQVVVVSPDYETPLRQPFGWETLVGIPTKGYPLGRLVFNDNNDQYPQTDLAVTDTLQLGIQFVLSSMVNEFRHIKEIIVAKNSAFQNADKARADILGPKDRVIVDVAEDSDVSDIIKLPKGVISADSYRIFSILERLLEKVSGLSGQRLGESRNVRTASEANLAEQGVQIRLSDKQRILDTYLAKKAIVWYNALKHFMSQFDNNQTFVLKAGGNVGKTNWINFTPFDIDFEVDIKVQPSSVRVVEKQERLQTWTMAVQAIQAFLPLLPNGVDVEKVLYTYLKAIGVDSPTEFVGVTVEQKVLQMAEIMRMILAGEELTVNVNDNHAIHVETIDEFMASDLRDLLLSSDNADNMNKLLQHRVEHVQALEGSTNSPPIGPNFFQNGAGGLGDEGRQKAAFQRFTNETNFGRRGGGSDNLR